MPHCIIEHSENMASQPLLQAVFAGALESALFAADGSDIKARAQAFAVYQCGTADAYDGFVHISLRILAGRTLEQKHHLLETVRNKLSDLALNKAAVTLEIIDMPRDTYLKMA